jgi:AcrR family transcriptional regulator
LSFQRARSQEQREQRRAKILETAVAMLEAMPVAELSLNELSRQVGLAKSNVLRYFETREAVLLELLDQGLREWADELSRVAPLFGGGARERGDRLAEAMASSLSDRPMLCELISAQSSVLERNVSSELVLHHKRATRITVARLTEIFHLHLPELRSEESYTVIAHTLLMTSAIWPHSRPSPAVLEAYAADAEIASGSMAFTDTIRHLVELTVSGLLARQREERKTDLRPID